MPDATPAVDNNKPQATKAAATAEKKVAVGYKVNLVLANGELAEAEVTKVHDPKTVDLKFVHLEKDAVITKSPHDPDGKLSDSWHAA